MFSVAVLTFELSFVGIANFVIIIKLSVITEVSVFCFTVTSGSWDYQYATAAAKQRFIFARH